MATLVLGTSLLLQLAAAIQAVRLIGITRWRLAWGAVAAALLLMAARRSITLYRVLSGETAIPPDLAAELVALLISGLMLFAVVAIGAMLAASKRTEQALQTGETALQARVAELEEVRAELEAKQAELVRFSEQLAMARDHANAANQAKSAFLANMSHELRTPLNAIIGFSEIMAKETIGPVGNPQYLEYAKDVNDSGQHLLALINDLLDLSKIESGAETVQDDELLPTDVARSVIAMVQPEVARKDLRLRLDAPNGLPALRADPRKLKQVVLNLVSNAVKFTGSGGTVTVKLWCRPDSGHVLQIADTGIGIAAEDIPVALSQFGQVDDALTRDYEGSGLGLPLSKALVELHGGCLDLQSEPGVGTTVTVRFPATRVVLPEGNGAGGEGGEGGAVDAKLAS